MTCFDEDGNYHSFKARNSIADHEYWKANSFFDLNMNRQVIVGSWKNIATDTVLTFYTDGRFRLVNGTIQYNGSYSWNMDDLVLDCGLFGIDDQIVNVDTFLGTRLELSHGFAYKPTYGESLLNGNYDYVFFNY